MHQGVPAIIEDIVQIIGGRVECAQYALCGTQELAENTVRALNGKKAVSLCAVARIWQRHCLLPKFWKRRRKLP